MMSFQMKRRIKEDRDCSKKGGFVRAYLNVLLCGVSMYQTTCINFRAATNDFFLKSIFLLINWTKIFIILDLF